MKRISVITLMLAGLAAASTAPAKGHGLWGKYVNSLPDAPCQPFEFCGGASGLDLIVGYQDCTTAIYKNHATCDEEPPDIEVPE